MGTVVRSSSRSNASSRSDAFISRNLRLVSVSMIIARPPSHVRVVIAAAHPSDVVNGAVGDPARGVLAGFEDRSDVRIPRRSDRPQRQRTRVLQTLGGIAFRQPQDARRGVPWRTACRSRRRSRGLFAGPIARNVSCPMVSTRLCRAGRTRSWTTGWMPSPAGAGASTTACSPCQTSSMLAPIRRSTVEPMYAYGTEYQLRAYATWLLACTLRPYTQSATS